MQNGITGCENLHLAFGAAGMVVREHRVAACIAAGEVRLQFAEL